MAILFREYINIFMKQGPHKRLSKKLKALQDPTRLKILMLLSKRPLCVCVITAAMQLAQPTISRHLSLLEGAGFIEKTKKGRMVIYELAPEDEVTQELLALVIKEASRDPEVKALLESVDAIEEAIWTNIVTRGQPDRN